MYDNAIATRPLPVVADTHIPVGSQITVTIGRNVPEHNRTPNGRYLLDGALPLKDWDEFRNQITLAVRLLCSATFGPFSGFGEWDEVTEESSVMIGLTSRPVDPDHVDAALASIAKYFGQDAVAWTYGPNLLATPQS